MSEREHLERAIAALEAQRAILGDAVVEASVAALRQQLAALEPPPAEQQRKLVTLLLADVSGFTALSETMDAEDVTDLMNALWRRLDTAILERGGRIDKHMGDAVMALWGTETAQEDDPVRAVRAALVMQEQVAAFAADRGTTLVQMRIGVHTGLVLLGAVGTTGELTAIGDAVNTASRLQYAAPLGGVLISHDTYRHVHGYFEVHPLDPVAVRGKTEPIRVYVVLRARPRAFRPGSRGVEGIETRMVGREAELRLLQDHFDQALAGQSGDRITISGEAGVGKSRLLYEFERWLELLPHQVITFKGRASTETQALPYALLRDLLASRLGLLDSDTASAAREKWERGLAQVWGEDENDQARSHILGQLVGYDFRASPHLYGVLEDARQLRDRGLLYLADYARAVTTAAPAVALLEDLHWADDSTLDAIEYLAQVTATGADHATPLIIVATARPALYERRPDWGPHHLKLQSLSPQDTHQLVAEILQKVDEVPEHLHELIVSGAEGNPFYVEELIKMLIEDGVIVKGAEHWRIEPERLTTVRVPPTLTGVLQARLDSLPAEQRTVLQQAAVVGRTFWDGAVVHISARASSEAGPVAGGILPSDPAQAVPSALSDLRGKEMVFRRPLSAFAGTEEYIFKHAVLREVTYESVLKRLRRVYHSLVADWLIAHGGERMSEITGLIAEHLEQAGRPAEALPYLRQAGAEAAARFANAEAVAYLTRALDLTPEEDTASRYDLLAARERVYDIQGNRLAQQDDLATLEQLAARLADPHRQVRVALRRAIWGEATCHYDTAIAAARSALGLCAPLPHTPGVAELEAEAMLRWGQALRRQGDYPAAQTQLEQALARAREGPLPRLEADALTSLGAIAVFQSNYARAQECFKQALDSCNQRGDRRGASTALNLLGVTSFYQDDYAGAQDYYDQALQICREIGDRLSAARAQANLGMIAFRYDDYAAAMAQTEQALDVLREVGNRQNVATGLKWCGHITLWLADYDRAADFYDQALQICRGIGDRWGEGEALGGIGDVLRLRGDFGGAQAAYEQSLNISREMRNREAESWVLNGLGDLARRQGQYELAQSCLERALHTAEDIGNRWHRNQALLYLTLLAHDLGTDEAGRKHCLQVLRDARELASRSLQASALTCLGMAQEGQGDLPAAAESYWQALFLWQEVGLQNRTLEPRAGLARVALALDDPGQGSGQGLAQARSHVEEILAALESGLGEGLPGVGDPFRVYLDCAEVLAAVQDPRGPPLVRTAYRLLAEQAATIADESQCRVFWDITTHRTLRRLATGQA